MPRAFLTLEGDHVVRWAGIPRLAYSVWTSTNLTNWVHAGFVQSTTTNFFFTNTVIEGGSLFYQVSYP